MRVWIVSGKHAIFVALKQAKYDFSCLYLSTKEYDKALKNIEIAYAYYSAHPEEEGQISQQR